MPTADSSAVRSSHTARRYSVYFENNGWRVDCGALHGLPSDPDKTVELALYPESDQSRLAGHAATTQVGPQKSDLKLLDIDADPSTRYQAEITSLPVPPLAVHLDRRRQGHGVASRSSWPHRTIARWVFPC